MKPDMFLCLVCHRNLLYIVLVELSVEKNTTKPRIVIEILNNLDIS